MHKKNICLLVNPFAGDGITMNVLKNVEETLKKFSINFRTIISSSVIQAQQVAIDAVNHDECVTVLGGDGSINVVASVLQQQKGLLAILPAGRGNDLARSLKIPLDPIAACQLLVNGKELDVDTAQINDHLFLTIGMLGIDSLANEIANKVKFIKGKMAYWYAALQALYAAKPIHYKIIIDGKQIEHVGYTVAVANSQCYGGGLYLAPTASLQDGLLDIVLIGKISKFQLLTNLPRLFKGTHIHEPGIKFLQGKHVIIHADSNLKFYADGDMIGLSPVEIKIMPRNLRILVPSDDLT